MLSVISASCTGPTENDCLNCHSTWLINNYITYKCLVNRASKLIIDKLVLSVIQLNLEN